jgi:hypothetical protein
VTLRALSLGAAIEETLRHAYLFMGPGLTGWWPWVTVSGFGQRARVDGAGWVWRRGDSRARPILEPPI